MDNKYVAIKNWAADDKPREKALKNGLNSLSDTELITILIGTGTKNKSALDIAKELYQSVGNDLNNLAKLSIPQIIKSCKGLGPAKATTIAIAFELQRRNITANKVPDFLLTINDSVNFLRPYFMDKQVEMVYAVYLARNQKVLAIEKLSDGGLTQSIVDIRILLKKCFEYNATNIILAHNHPSGSVYPSNADIAITQKIQEACKTMDILLTDHLIITNTNHCSIIEYLKE